MSCLTGSGSRALSVGLALLLAGPVWQSAANAQGVGDVQGRVTNQRSGSPLSAVQITVEEPGGPQVMSGEDGSFTLSGLAAGSHRLRVQSIGFRPLMAQVTVATGQATKLDLVLEEQVLALDEVVVTGTPGTARRREVGNTISQINIAEVEQAPASTQSLLQASAPGLNVLQGSGSIGAGSNIRLRGNVSVAMSNEPLIYIDGVRMRSEGYPVNTPPGQNNRGPNTNASPLNDINPADIERVEIIKGAAATTLYGTEAAAGVIQIFTKRGAVGRPEWTLQVDQGFDKSHKFGTDAVPYMYLDPWLKTAWRQNYNGAVKGGAEGLQYFVSGNLERNKGVLPLDSEKKVHARGNFTFTPQSQLQLSLNTSYTDYDLSQTPAGNNAHGLVLNAYTQTQNYVASDKKEDIDKLLKQDNLTHVGHLITGLSAVYTPRPNLTNRLTLGYDLANYESRNLRPYGFVLAPLGILGTRNWTNTVLTVDYAASFDFKLASNLQSSLSGGFQSVTTETNEVSALAQDFPGPGDPTVSSAARSQAFESRMRVINGGFFVQNLLGFKNRYFLTAGLRVDGNSAFGSGLGLQAYPKVSLSYVVSEEPFWPAALGDVKLRAAYGQAGRAPGAFDAVRTWNPVGWAGQVAFWPRNLGNSDLGPERTAEWEVGLDGAFLNQRLNGEFTYYHRKTTDALVGVTQTPSLGQWGSQLENVGLFESKGVELSLRGAIIDKPNLGLNLGASLSTNYSKVLDLGGAAPFTLGNLGWIMEGQPLPVLRGDYVSNPREIADYQLEKDHLFGPNMPTHIIGINGLLRFPGNIQLSGRGEYQGGNYIFDNGSWSSLVRGHIANPLCLNARALDAAGQADQKTAWERKWCNSATVGQDTGPIYPVDFFKIREVMLSVPLTFAVSGARSATLQLSGRNIWTWKNKDFLAWDPEMTGNEGTFAAVRVLREQVPAPATVTASVRVVF